MVFLWLGLLVKLVRNVCGLLQKLYTKKLVKKKNKNYCAEGVWSVTLTFAFTKQLVFEYFYPSFMHVAG